MIGMEDYASEGLKDGTIVDVLVLSVGPSASGLALLQANQEIELKRAAALGMDPASLDYSYKLYGMSVDYAIISAGDDRIVTGSAGNYKLPNYNHTGKITQLSLMEVYNRSKALHQQGKEYGYNFQKQGGGNSFATNSYPAIVNLHPNPNIEKDWDSGVSVANISDSDREKYAELLGKEANRLAKWETVADSWNQLTEEQAVTELKEGLARRLLLYTKTGNKPVYVEPTPGMVVKAKVVRRAESKYFDLVLFAYDKANKTYNCFVDKEKDCSFVIDEETIQMANEVKDLIESARNAYKARMASTAVSQAVTSSDEWE